MRLWIFNLVVLLLFTGCASEQYNQRLQSFFAYELDPNLNRFSEKHMACYVCETGVIPTAVSQLIAYKATTDACIPFFNEKEISFFDPAEKDYIITMKPMEGRDVYVFTKDGLKFDELDEVSGKQSFFTMTLWHDRHECLPSDAQSQHGFR